MRFRSIGICASNKKDYLSSIKEIEDSYINESTLAHIGYISLEETNLTDELLGPHCIYKISKLKNQRRKRRKFQKYRKKLYFYRQTKTNVNNKEINLINN